MFIRNSGYHEHILMIPISSFYCSWSLQLRVLCVQECDLTSWLGKSPHPSRASLRTCTSSLLSATNFLCVWLSQGQGVVGVGRQPRDSPHNPQPFRWCPALVPAWNQNVLNQWFNLLLLCLKRFLKNNSFKITAMLNVTLSNTNLLWIWNGYHRSKDRKILQLPRWSQILQWGFAFGGWLIIFSASSKSLLFFHPRSLQHKLSMMNTNH